MSDPRQDARELADIIAKERSAADDETRSFRHRLILPHLGLIEAALREYAVCGGLELVTIREIGVAHSHGTATNG